MAKSRRLLALTGGIHQIPVIRTAQSMGLAVVVTDRDPSAPGLLAADYPVIVDAKDHDAILAVARQHGVSGVIAEQSDVAVLTAASVAEALGLPGIGIAVARRATDKYLMREACHDAGIPTPKYRYVATAAEARKAVASIGLPVVVKPTDSQSSRGVTKVAGSEQLDAAFGRAKAESRSGGILVEEMMVGREGSIESFVSDGRVHVLGFCDKVKCAPPFSFDLRLIYPGDYSAAVMDDILAMNDAVITAIGINTGLVHVEFIATQAGVRLIEIAARGCGARVATDLLPALTGADIIGLRIRQAIGEPATFARNDGHEFGILRFLELPPGQIVGLGDTRQAAALENVVLLHFPHSLGDVIPIVESGDARPGFVIGVGKSRDDVIALAERAIQILDVHVKAG